MLDSYDIDLLAFGFSILNCVPRATRLLTIPNGKNCVGVVYHIIVPHEHAGAEVVVIDQRNFVGFIKDSLVSRRFGGRPFQGLIRAGDSAFQLDVKVVMLPKLNDCFGKVHIDTESHSGNKVVVTIFKIVSNSASKGLDIILNTKHFLGYTRDKKGTVLKIVPEEAITVRRIYAEFLDGKSLKEIAEGLERDGIASPSGRETWHPSTVKSILQNEKYKGDCHLQKTYLPDFLSPRRIKNEGFAQSWYVEDSHAAIISKETFEMVQQEFQNRQSLRSTGETGCGKFSGKYPFSGMIVCGECGETYRRHQQYNKYKKYYIWVCKRHENTGAEYCKSRPIKEEALEKAFVRALNELIGDKEQILEKLQSAIVSEITDSCATAINEVSAEIEKLQEQMMELLTIRNNGEITDKEYEHQSQQVGMKIDQLLMRKEEILSEQGKVQLASYRIEEVTKLLQTGKILEEFDRVMFKSLVRKITVLSNKEIEIEFECGITVRETL